MAKDASKDGDVPYATRWFENGVQKEVIGAVDEAAPVKYECGWNPRFEFGGSRRTWLAPINSIERAKGDGF